MEPAVIVMSQENIASIPFRFSNKLVLRTPAVPFVSQLDKHLIETLLEDKGFMEAIYLASPVLHAECKRLKNGSLKDDKETAKVITSLSKYYQRMYSRCTPFGLFSGCTVVDWDENGPGIVIPAQRFYRSTRLDMHYLCALSQHISSMPVVQERLRFFPNNSNYQVGNELRYIEYRYQNGRRVHQISSVSWSDYLEAVLQKAAGGALLRELSTMLQALADVSPEEAAEFIQDMVDSQVLIGETDPAITGDEFIHQLLLVLKRINEPNQQVISELIGSMEKIMETLRKVDDVFCNDITVYTALIEQVRELGVNFEESKLFQADLFSRPTQRSIHTKHKQELLKTVDLLARVFSSAKNEQLEAFADRYRSRYEDRLMPLLQVLDAETGIGYLQQSGSNLSPLVENLVLPATVATHQYDIKWNKTEQWLFSKLLSANGKEEIVITEEELLDFTADYSILPPSLAVLFSVAENGQLLFKGASGSSATNLLGRFAHAETEINALATDIVKAEEELNPGVLFAEIIHLPEDRVGNILLHPAFRNWEIPFLARSSVEAERQIPLQDIMVQVQGDKRIRLFSKKLQREIIPRLSNAHNFSFNSLPVYHFLAAMQTCGLSNGLNWNWGTMARHFKNLPSVKYGQVILSEASWQLGKADLESLFAATGTSTEKIGSFINQWNLPARFVLADGDNELLVDTTSILSVETFIKTIKGRDAVVIKKFFPPDPGTVKNEKGETYCNQFIAVLLKTENLYPGAARFPVAPAVVKRSFHPGSEWLYYKIYCGTKTADELLQFAVLPFTHNLLEAKLISKWFFIRYNDPDFHIRLRLYIPDPRDATQVMQRFIPYIEQMTAHGLAWKVQVDTYERETERYGNELVELAEELFYQDSMMKMEFLSITGGDERENQRWPWALRGVDELLNVFDYTADRKYSLMQQLQKQFSTEFNADKEFYRQLNRHYSSNRKVIEDVMTNPVNNANPFFDVIVIYENGREKMRRAADAIRNAVAENEAVLDTLLSSYIHMKLNRIFLSEARLHELVIYDMLCSFYRSLQKRKKG